ncbi:MAG: glycosyltransferase [Desulfobacteraceae bacterium]
MIETPDQENLLQAYFKEAVAIGAVPQAVRFLDRLLETHPWNHSIRGMLIALFLKQEDYPAAMECIETLMAFSTPDDALIDAALSVREHLGPDSIQKGSPSKRSISLCMIVKNERAFMGPCLNSVRKLVDEIVVVDTGSNDRSADIATVYGARVYHSKWRDDFSEVRNISLDKAQGDWILILDADEVIAPQDFDALWRTIQTDETHSCAYSLQTRNYLNLANTMEWQPNDNSYPQQEAGIGWFPTDKVRLFPNRSDIRFVFPVHEMVDTKLRAAGIGVRACPVPVHHYGLLNEAKNKRKAETYFKLGYTKLDQLGNDPVALRELAVQAGQLGRWIEAIDLWKRLLDVRPGYPEAFVNMAGACWQLGRYDKGIAYSKKAIQANPDLKEGHYNLAVNMIMKGQADSAAAVLKALLQKHERYLPARFMLAAAHCVVVGSEEGCEGFSALVKEMSPQVLRIAVEDLVGKLMDSGRSDYADAIKASACMD